VQNVRFKVNANVITTSGDKVGEVERVVLDPKTKEITHVVVRKGFLFTEDKVVPINLVASATEGEVRLREDAGDLEALPKYEKEHYILADERELAHPQTSPQAAHVPAPAYWYPPFGPSTVGEPTEPITAEPEGLIQTKEYNVPEGTVALKEGAEVFSADREHVGDVEQVLTDPQADRVTHFVIAEGLLLKERKLVPYRWVNEITGEGIELAVGSSFLEKLPEYKN
jgi:uncharacterized protein YrrD